MGKAEMPASTGLGSYYNSQSPETKLTAPGLPVYRHIKTIYRGPATSVSVHQASLEAASIISAEAHAAIVPTM
jgi:hypothetical protein